ncbi:unnamed protein product [Mycena citricolor]|uniref:VTT domain-containing protein n=1 Tax=Mycena citricolor TaxID=2018698 RepID=A0AAD2GSB0_9AGAR|nr:unnamed protein product [Mycena citricolor]
MMYMLTISKFWLCSRLFFLYSSFMLSPPSFTRARSSSTSKTLSVCTRRAAQAPNDAPESPMLYLVASRILDWTHLSSHSRPSPHLGTPELVLPLSTPAYKTAFSKTDLAPPPASQSRFSSAHLPAILVLILFPLSTALVLLSLTTLPITVSWPHTLPDLAQLGRELHGYCQSGPIQTTHVVAVLSLTAIWKHAWSVPGSVIWNVLAGALFSPAFATILLTTLTTIGSLCATLLAMPLGPVITRFFPRALDVTRRALDGSDASSSDTDTTARSPAWVRLCVMRLIGVVPWSGINIACGVCGVTLWDCAMGCFIGSLPWTAVTCQIGDILQTVASHPSPTPQTVSSLLTSPEIIIKLVLLSFLSLAPVLGRSHLRSFLTAEAEKSSPSSEKRSGRWSVGWVQDWRTKIRGSSRSREPSLDEQLSTLVDEKRVLEARQS